MNYGFKLTSQKEWPQLTRMRGIRLLLLYFERQLEQFILFYIIKNIYFKLLNMLNHIAPTLTLPINFSAQS